MLLIANYLASRHQYVQIDEKFSNREIVTNEIPQGSILGKILFNIYVHDLKHETCATCVQNADETSIHHNFKPEHLLENAQMNTDFKNIASG